MWRSHNEFKCIGQTRVSSDYWLLPARKMSKNKRGKKMKRLAGDEGLNALYSLVLCVCVRVLVRSLHSRRQDSFSLMRDFKVVRNNSFRFFFLFCWEMINIFHCSSERAHFKKARYILIHASIFLLFSSPRVPSVFEVVMTLRRVLDVLVLPKNV